MDDATASVIIAGFTAGAGVVGACVGSALQARATARQWVRERTARREEKNETANETASRAAREAAFSALELADALERYALACAHVVSDNSIDPYAPNASPWINVPDLPTFPSEVEWRFLGVGDASNVRHFRAQTELAKVRLNAAADLIDGDELIADAAEQAALLGTRSWELASCLRENFGLPPFRTDELAWDYMETIRNILERRAQMRREQELGGG